MKKLLLLIMAMAIGRFIFAQDCSDLFISEYVEGSINNKAIEIYNPTDAAIDLGNYSIYKYTNGSPVPTDELQLSGTILPYDVVVVTNGQTDSIWVSGGGGYWSLPIDEALYDLGDLHCSGEYPTVMYFNGNDAITLETITGDVVDIFGKVGTDPGSNGWNDIPPTYFAGDDWWSSWTKDQTLIRKPSVMTGVTDNPDIFMVNVEWDSLPKNTFENLGFHDCDCYMTGNADKPWNAKVDIFPNPVANGKMNIVSEESITRLELLNALGQTVQKEALPPRTKRYAVELEQFHKGVYFVKLSLGDDNTLVKKIVIE